MSKPQLTVERLLDGGFEEIGCWELNAARDLSHSIDLPRNAGVYAFTINGVVQYVGLASRSLHQRLNFYRKPGASQRTNIRLNGIIKGQIGAGATVRILVANPPDQEWNAFRIKGPEGLEAGLVAEFDLPWNMRGTQVPATNGAKPTSRGARIPSDRKRLPKAGSASAKILDVVGRRPGMTELEIAKAIYGPSGLQQQVNQDCRLLVADGAIERRGGGGRSDPFTYHLRAGS